MSKNEEVEKNKNEILNVKKISKKIISSEKNEIIENVKEKKSEKKTKAEKKKTIDENVVIEKIKSFLAKIVAMQEESEKEENVKATKSSTKSSAKERNKKVSEKSNFMLEYYDLPYRYNETIVKILAQTPKKLFVYWDVSDNDRNRYIETFGDRFFEATYPVLLVYNEDKKYVKEVPINDFANSWYIDIDDPKTKYTIQLGRKFIDRNQVIDIEKVKENNIDLQTDYLPFANSNVLEAPNDHVLLEFLPKHITFRNVKTNKEFVKNLRKINKLVGKNYDVEEFYQNQYAEELSDGMFDMENPSSNLSSSTFK